MIDYASNLFAPIFNTYGVAAVLVVAEGEPPVSLTVIDRTKGIAVRDDPEEQTVRPACRVRMSELASKGVAVEHLDGGHITFNGITWRIEAHQKRPNSQGETAGTVDLFLLDDGAEE